MNKKILSIVCILLALAFAVTACTPPGGASNPASTAGGGSSSKEVKGEITYWNMNAGGARDAAYEEIAAKFSEKYPGTKVTVSHFPAQEAQTKMELAASSNDMPDVSDNNPTTVSTLRAMGVLYPLDDYLADAENIQNVMPNLIDVWRSYSPDGKLYGVPRNAQLSILWYRSDKMQPAQTWDEFFNTASSLTDKNSKEYGYIIRGKDGAYDAISIAYMYSGITEFFTADGKCTLNDPKHVEILERYYAMYKNSTAESDIAAAFKEMTAAFGSGAVQMFYHNTGSYGDHIKNLGEGKFAATILPAGNPNSKVILDQGSPGMILSKSKGDPYTGFKFIDFFNSVEMQSLYHKAVGTVPTNMKVFEEQWAKDVPHFQMVLDHLSGTTGYEMVAIPVYLPDCAKIKSDIGDIGFQNVMTGETTIKKVLDDMAIAFENAYKEYLANAK